MRVKVGDNVLNRALDRYRWMFKSGHRVVVSFSGGKDSGVCVELAIMVSKELGMGPVDVIMRDEEIMVPGTFEYAERLANRTKEVNFHWIYANQPVTNVFNRANPYFWVFDPLLDSSEWVRTPPPFAYKIDVQNIDGLVGHGRFPVSNPDMLPPKPFYSKKNRPITESGDRVCVMSIIGLRVEESAKRNMGLATMGGNFYTGVFGDYKRNAFPIYDWTTGDVWKAHKEFGWDYCNAYDVMLKMGIKPRDQRIAPPTLNTAAINNLWFAASAWPHWFDRVATRLPGVRTAAKFGKSAISPYKKLNETWEECFYRENVAEAPKWIADRALILKESALRRHANHSTTPFPDVYSCKSCGLIGSWKELTYKAYHGDPMCTDGTGLPPVEPEFFRPGAGVWGGSAAFA